MAGRIIRLSAESGFAHNFGGDHPEVMFQGQGDISKYCRTPQGARLQSMLREAHHQVVHSCASARHQPIATRPQIALLC